MNIAFGNLPDELFSYSVLTGPTQGDATILVMTFTFWPLTDNVSGAHNFFADLPVVATSACCCLIERRQRFVFPGRERSGANYPISAESRARPVGLINPLNSWLRKVPAIGRLEWALWLKPLWSCQAGGHCGWHPPSWAVGGTALSSSPMPRNPAGKK